LAGETSFLSFAYFQAIRHGVPVSLSMDPGKALESRPLLHRIGKELYEENSRDRRNWLIKLFEENPAAADQEASRYAQSFRQTLEDELVELEEAQQSFEAEGALEGLLRTDANPSNAMAGYGAFKLLKSLALRHSSDEEKLLFSHEGEVTPEDLMALKAYLVKNELATPFQLRKFEQAYYFFGAVERLKQTNPELFFRESFHPEKLSKVAAALAADPDAAKAGISWKAEEDVREFEVWLKDLKQNLFWIHADARREAYEKTFSADVVQTRKTVLSFPDGNREILIVKQKKSGLALYSERHAQVGFEYSDFDTFHALTAQGERVSANDLGKYFVIAPETVAVLLRELPSETRFSPVIQRAIRFAAERWDEANQRRFHQWGWPLLQNLLSEDRNIFYPIVAANRLGIFGYFFSPSANVTPAEMDLMERTLMSMEKLADQEGSSLQEVRRTFLNLRKDPAQASLLRQAVFRGHLGDISGHSPEFLAKIQWLNEQRRKLFLKDLFSRDDLEKAVTDILDSMNRFPHFSAQDKSDLLKTLYVLFFSEYMASETADQLGLVLSEGRESPFAAIDQIFAASLEVVQRGLQPGMALDSALHAVVQKESAESAYEKIAELIKVGGWRQVMDKFLDETHDGSFPGLKTFLEQVIQTGADLASGEKITIADLYRQYRKTFSGYYRETLSPEDLLAQLFFMAHLAFVRQLEERGEKEAPAIIRPRIFRRIDLPYHHGREIMFGVTKDHPGLTAVYFRALSHYGFEIMTASPQMLSDGSAMVWFLGHFPQTMDAESALFRVRKDLDRYLTMPPFWEELIRSRLDSNREEVTREAWKKMMKHYGPVTSRRLPDDRAMRKGVAFEGNNLTFSITARTNFMKAVFALLYVKFPEVSIRNFSSNVLSGRVDVEFHPDKKLNDAKRRQIQEAMQAFIDSEETVISNDVKFRSESRGPVEARSENRGALDTILNLPLIPGAFHSQRSVDNGNATSVILRLESLSREILFHLYGKQVSGRLSGFSREDLQTARAVMQDRIAAFDKKRILETFSRLDSESVVFENGILTGRTADMRHSLRLDLTELGAAASVFLVKVVETSERGEAVNNTIYIGSGEKKLFEQWMVPRKGRSELRLDAEVREILSHANDPVPGLNPFSKLAAYADGVKEWSDEDLVRAYFNLTRDYGKVSPLGVEEFDADPLTLKKKSPDWSLPLIANNLTTVNTFMQMMRLEGLMENEEYKTLVLSDGKKVLIVAELDRRMADPARMLKIRNILNELKRSQIVSRYLDMPPEAAAKIKRIFILGHQSLGQEQLSYDVKHFGFLVPLLLARFPNAQLDLAIDYVELFDAKRFHDRVKQARVPRGILNAAVEEGKASGLVDWMKVQKYDLAFDFTRCGSGIQEALLDQAAKFPSSRFPVALINMSPELTDQGEVPQPVFVIDVNQPSGEQVLRVPGTENVLRPTPEGRGPREWEMILRFYRELGLYKSRFNLQLVQYDVGKLEASENEWVKEKLKQAFYDNGTGVVEAANLMEGARPFIYVNIFSNAALELSNPEDWEKLAAFVLKETDGVLFFSSGGYKDHADISKLDQLLQKLRARFPEDVQRLVRMENLRVPEVILLMRVMDMVVTPDHSGFQDIATILNKPQMVFALSELSPTLSYRKETVIVTPGNLDDLPAMKLLLEGQAERKNILTPMYTRLQTEEQMDEILTKLVSGVLIREEDELYQVAGIQDDGPRPFRDLRKFYGLLQQETENKIVARWSHVVAAHGGSRFAGISPTKLHGNKPDWRDLYGNQITPISAYLDMWQHPRMKEGFLDPEIRVDLYESGEVMLVLARVAEMIRHGRGAALDAIFEQLANRSELRLEGSTAHIKESLLQDAVPVEGMTPEAERLITQTARYLADIYARQDVAGRMGTAPEDRNVQRWIAVQLMKPLRAMAEKQQMSDARLAALLDHLKSLAARDGDVSDGKAPAVVLQTRLPAISQDVWDALKRSRLLFGALAGLRAKLVFNTDAGPEAAAQMQREMSAAAEQWGFYLDSGQIEFRSVGEGSLWAAAETTARLAGDDDSLKTLSEKLGSRWRFSAKVLEKGERLAQDIITLIYALQDPKIKYTDDIRTPSQYEQLFAAVREAMMAAEQLAVSA